MLQTGKRWITMLAVALLASFLFWGVIHFMWLSAWCYETKDGMQACGDPGGGLIGPIALLLSVLSLVSFVFVVLSATKRTP